MKKSLRDFFYLTCVSVISSSCSSDSNSGGTGGPEIKTGSGVLNWIRVESSSSWQRFGSAMNAGDCNGDGTEDVSVAYGDGSAWPFGIGIYSGLDGKFIKQTAEKNYLEYPKIKGRQTSGLDIDGVTGPEIVLIGRENEAQFGDSAFVYSCATNKFSKLRHNDDSWLSLIKSVSWAPDIDNDGVKDLLFSGNVGVLSHSTIAFLSSKTGAVLGKVVADAPDFRLSAWPIGDFNADGQEDFAIIHGKRKFLDEGDYSIGVISLSSLIAGSKEPYWKSNEIRNFTGITALGDTNNDGAAEFIAHAEVIDQGVQGDVVYLYSKSSSDALLKKDVMAKSTGTANTEWGRQFVKYKSKAGATLLLTPSRSKYIHFHSLETLSDVLEPQGPQDLATSEKIGALHSGVLSLLSLNRILVDFESEKLLYIAELNL